MLAKILFLITGLIFSSADVSIANTTLDQNVKSTEDLLDYTQIDLAVFDNEIFSEARVDIQVGK